MRAVTAGLCGAGTSPETKQTDRVLGIDPNGWLLGLVTVRLDSLDPTDVRVVGAALTGTGAPDRWKRTCTLERDDMRAIGLP